jgi:hypothetical protein
MARTTARTATAVMTQEIPTRVAIWTKLRSVSNRRSDIFGQPVYGFGFQRICNYFGFDKLALRACEYALFGTVLPRRDPGQHHPDSAVAAARTFNRCQQHVGRRYTVHAPLCRSDRCRRPQVDRISFFFRRKPENPLSHFRLCDVGALLDRRGLPNLIQNLLEQIKRFGSIIPWSTHRLIMVSAERVVCPIHYLCEIKPVSPAETKGAQLRRSGSPSAALTARWESAPNAGEVARPRSGFSVPWCWTVRAINGGIP